MADTIPHARIYKPAKTAMQSGRAKMKRWFLICGDVKMTFVTSEQAVQYAQQQGYTYEVEKPQERNIPPARYDSNFILPHIRGSNILNIIS